MDKDHGEVEEEEEPKDAICSSKKVEVIAAYEY